MPFSVIILLLVFALIMVRQWLPVPFRIWQIMLLGAMLMLLTGQVSVVLAYHLINWNIVGFLFAVFILGLALEKSGILYAMSQRCFARCHHMRTVI